MLLSCSAASGLCALCGPVNGLNLLSAKHTIFLWLTYHALRGRSGQRRPQKMLFNEPNEEEEEADALFDLSIFPKSQRQGASSPALH